MFLDAFLPQDGDCILERGNPALSNAVRDAVQRGELALPAPPAGFFRVNDADRAWVDRMCTPHPLRTYTDRLALTGARERIPRKTYIRAEAYAQPAFDAAYARLSQDASWRVRSVPSGHDVMIDAPERLTQMLLDAA